MHLEGTHYMRSGRVHVTLELLRTVEMDAYSARRHLQCEPLRCLALDWHVIHHADGRCRSASCSSIREAREHEVEEETHMCACMRKPIATVCT